MILLSSSAGTSKRWQKLRLEKLTPIDLINYRQSLIKVQGLKPATVNRRLEALRRLCRWAHQQKLLTANIAQEPRRLTQPQHIDNQRSNP